MYQHVVVVNLIWFGDNTQQQDIVVRFVVSLRSSLWTCSAELEIHRGVFWDTSKLV